MYQLPKALPGQRQILNLRLKPGVYKLSCSLADHAARGMRATLRVRAADELVPRPRSRRCARSAASGAGSPQAPCSTDSIDDQVHELAVDELLERHRPEHPGRLAVEAERVPAERELKRREDGQKASTPTGLRKMKPVDREDVDQRREQRQRDLEEDEIRQPATADPSLASAARSRPGASRPPGSFRSTSGSAVARARRVSPAPPSTRGRPRRRRRATRRGRSRSSGPCPRRASLRRRRRRPRAPRRRNAPTAPGTVGMHWRTSNSRRSRLKPITYSMCCQRPSSPWRLPTFVLPETAPIVGEREGLHEVPERLGLEDRVRVDHDDDRRDVVSAIPRFSAAGLPAFA